MDERGTTREKERTLQAVAVAAELHREYGNIDQALDAMISIVSADPTLVDQAIRDSCRRKLRIWYPRRWDGMAPSVQSTPMRVKPTRRRFFGSKIAEAIQALIGFNDREIASCVPVKFSLTVAGRAPESAERSLSGMADYSSIIRRV